MHGETVKYKRNVINMQNFGMLNLVLRTVTGRFWKVDCFRPWL